MLTFHGSEVSCHDFLLNAVCYAFVMFFEGKNVTGFRLLPQRVSGRKGAKMRACYVFRGGRSLVSREGASRFGSKYDFLTFWGKLVELRHVLT